MTRADGPRQGPPVKPMGDAEIRTLERLLENVPAPLDPLDASMLDGFLCGVLVQPEPVSIGRWMPHVTDGTGRALPRSFDPEPLRALVLRRHAELAQAIAQRRWFDPWVFEPSEDDDPDAVPSAGADADDDAAARAVSAAVLPWVAGIATAFELFPALTEADDDATRAPLALLYRHLDADDLEDADALLAEIESIEPATELGDAIEGLVRAVLLLADASRGRGPG